MRGAIGSRVPNAMIFSLLRIDFYFAKCATASQHLSSFHLYLVSMPRISRRGSLSIRYYYVFHPGQLGECERKKREEQESHNLPRTTKKKRMWVESQVQSSKPAAAWRRNVHWFIISESVVKLESGGSEDQPLRRILVMVNGVSEHLQSCLCHVI